MVCGTQQLNSSFNPPLWLHSASGTGEHAECLGLIRIWKDRKMYAVGRVGTYIAQGVYTFSGPFHPFGGAVDIIVVQQEDGTFKSSPWYVKFGKFQGVLKRREKKVLVAVNDVEANFHMYLDHKGEAYFLKDDASPEIDEFAALSANEAASSGDESSVRHLAIEYPKGEEGQDAKADNDKEESEDERGDDLELRFEGREASKQLIQQSVEERAAAAALELAFAHQHQENKVAGVDGLKVSEDEDTNPLDNLTSLYLERGSSADACRSEPLTNETEFPAFLNQVLDLEASQASSACSGNGAFTLLSTAPVSEAKTSPENSEPDRIPPSNNGMVVHGLLNKALGLQDSENSGPGNALLASATLNSLARVVVNNQPISSIRNYTGPKLVELSEDDVGGTEEKDGMPRSTETNLTSEEGSFPEDSGGAPTCIDQSLTDVKAVDTVTTSVNLSVVEIQPKSVDTTLPSVLLPLTSGPDAHGSEHPNLLKVTNIEIIDESLPIESPGQTNYLAGKIPHKVQESIPAYSRDTIENGVHLESLDDTKELLERPRVSQDSTSKNGVQEGKLGIPKKEKDPLAGSEDTEPQQTVVVPNVQSQVLDEKVKATGAPKTVTESSRSEKIAVAESMKEVVMQQPEKVTEMVSTSTEKFTDVGSPRHKAAIELEMSWREVMEKAAVALKSAPLTGKDYSRSRSLARVVGSDSGQRKASEEMGGLPEQAEKKSWLWFHWGGSSVPQAKQSVDDVRNDNGNSRKIVELGEDEAEKDQTGKKASLEDAATRNTLDKHDLGFNLETENLGSASGREVQAMGDAKLGECKSTVEAMRTENNDVASRSKAEEDGDTADIRSQPKAGSSGSKRRSIFGMLSRSNTNQSSLSATSSIKSTDDVQDFAEGLKRVTSIERAESVVDLLDTKWARGEGPKGLMAVARVPDSKVSKHSVNKNLEVGIFQVDKEGSESVPTSLDDLSSGVVVQIPAPDVEKNGVIDTVDSSTTCADSTVPQALVKLVLDQVDEHIRANPSDSDKDSRSAKATGVEATEGEVDDVGVESPLTISQTNQDAGEFISNRKAKVVLMSIDGHLITAPLESVDDANAQTPFESLSKKYHESVEDSECTGGSPKMAVSFAEAPEVALAPIVSRSEYLQDGEENNFAQSGTETPEEDDGQSNSSVQSDSKLDSRGSPNIEGLKVAVNNVGARQSKADSSGANDTDALARGNSKLELTSDNKEDVKFGGDVIYRSDATGSQEFDEVRARVFEKLDEPSEGESPDQSAEKYERFYSSRDLETERRPLRRNLSLYVDAFSNSSKDLSEADEGLKTPVRRNVSIYMDALSGDEDDEDEEQVESFRGNSIPIPGAFDRSRKAQSLDDIQILRAVSESLPNSGESDIHGKVLSPRLAISRSVGSEPLVLSQDLNEAVASTDGIQRSQSFSSPLSSRREDGNPLQHGRTGEMTTTTPKDTTDELNFVGQTTASAKNRIEGKGMGVAETGFRLSLCRHLLTDHMGLEAAGKAFASERVSLDDFKKSGAAIAANDKLVVQVGARYYPWVVAAPIVLGILGFGQVLIAPNEGAIPVEKPDVIADGKPSVGTLTTTSSGGWKLWPFSRSTRTPEPGTASVLLPRQADALMLATHAALKSPLTEDYLRMNGYYKKPRKVRTNSPSSVQLGSLGLKEGSNKITFTFVTRVLGKQQVDARIYLWKWNTRIVISDVDGTITRSDVLGQVMPLVGKDWTQSGVARLFSAIKKNGYELMFLSARAISQAYLTRQFLENIKQDGEVLPDGPVVISPDGLFPSLYREVIRRAPHEFKIACLEDIKSLFPPESKPFYAGFGNRDTDELSYLKVGISKGKIFIINPKGEVVVNNQVEVKSYGSLHKLVNDMFPAMTSTEQEDFNDLNFWKLPLPDIEDDQSQKSAGSSSSRRSSKVADRHQ